jgi:hypothetical protein
MSGIVDRRNQSAYWSGRITYTRLKRKITPKCDDCWLNVHAEGGTSAWVIRAKWTRTNTPPPDATGQQEKVTTYLCDSHKQAWADWTPGQQELA